MHYKKYAEIPHEEKWDGLTLDYKYIDGFSPLFYESEGTHRDLDHDADSFLESVITRYWAEDFVSLESSHVLALVEEKNKAYKASYDFFNSSEYFQSRNKEDLFSRVRGEREKNADETEFSRLLGIRDDISERIVQFIPTFLREVIKVDYTYEGPIDKQGEYEDTPYNHAIIREPGKYLYHYFNDQMVFDNYVQIITVPKLDEGVVDLLDSGVLLEPIVRDRFWTYSLDRVIDVVERNFRGWWT